jgi:hypothetical protein
MMDKAMIAARVTESYTSLFLTPHKDGSRNAAIARFGALEVRLLEISSVNAPEILSLWVELYARNYQVGLDSCECSDLDEAIDAAEFLITQARLLNNEAEQGRDDGCAAQNNRE